MIDAEDIFPIIFAIIVAVFLFFGLITTLKKSFKPPPETGTVDSQMELKEQRWRMEDIRRRQEDLMRSQRDKMRDLQRR